MKRIIVACDGTGQSASRGAWSTATNVNRICHALLNSTTAPVQQIVFYQSGVGTQDLIPGSLDTVIQGALGAGLEEHVADAYTFMMNNYLPGDGYHPDDEIFIFGFSRGAFTARVLANILARLGVFSQRNTWRFKDALQKYKEGPQAFNAFIDGLRKEMEERREQCTPEMGEYVPIVYDVKVKVVGCWDTVASLGFPWQPITNASE